MGDRAIIRGRDAELAQLGARLADAVGGRGSVTVVVGAAGIGKSRLLAEAVQVARRLSIPTMAGASAPGHELAAMGVLLRALGDVVDPAEVAAARGAPGERLALLDLAESGLERAAIARPLLVAMDDVQWADPWSVAAVAELAVRLAGLPVAWVLASREPLALTGAEEIALAPLSEASVATIVRDAVGADPGPRLLRAARRADGNAHALAELLAGVVAEGLVTTAGGRADLVDDRLPRRVGDAMRVRLARVSPAGGELAAAAAVVGGSTELEVLADVLACPPSSLRAALTELQDAGLATPGEEVAFPHDLLREAVLATIPSSRRRALDRRAANALLARGSAPSEIASRLAASAQPGDAEATALLLTAARSLAATDATAAAELARRGFDLADGDDPSRVALAVEATLLLHAANRPHEARDFAAATLDGVLSDDERGELLLSVAWLFDTATEDQARAGRDALALDLSPQLRARHLTRLVATLFTAGRVPESQALLGDALAATQAVGGARMRFEAALAEAATLWGATRFLEGLQLIDAAMRTADRGQLGLLVHWRADFLHGIDEIDGGLQLIGERSATAQRAGQAWEAQLWEQKRGRHLVQAGRPLEAIATLDGLYEHGTGEPTAADTMAIVALGRAAVHAGDDERLRDALAQLPRMFSSVTPEVRRQGAFLLLVSSLAAGQDAATGRALDVLMEGGELTLPAVFVDLAAGPVLVRGALACDRPHIGRAAVAWQRARALANPGVATLAGALAHAEALLHGADVAPAVELLRAGPRPLLLASALEDLGGIEALSEALDLYAAAGARSDERRVRRHLRALGVRRAPRTDAGGGPLRGLTTMETDVARLVAQGLTNREVAARLYLSPHTVSTHLRHVFAKLGISSRVELVGLVDASTGTKRWEQLTPAERRIVQRVAAGLSNRAVADELGVSPHTISSHLWRAYRKLGVRTRTELASALLG